MAESRKRRHSIRLCGRSVDPSTRSQPHRGALWSEVPPLPCRAHSAQDRLQLTKANQASQPTRRGCCRAVDQRRMAHPQKKWEVEGRTILTILFVDESNFYLLPAVVR